LAADGVARRFGSQVALAPTSIQVRAGETLALIGPNGAGKSTLLAILAGALAPSSGRVSAAEPPRRIGWVPQRAGLYGRLSARENLVLFAKLEGVPDVPAAVEGLLRLVALPDDRKPAAELSGGNQQRLNLAIALLGAPDLLLLDEPTAALDPTQRHALWAVASDVRERGGAVVFATQNLEELERVADRVAVLLGGKLVFDGSIAEYKRSPEADVFA
jgi:ABC-2 type transport system ATP-binding protein